MDAFRPHQTERRVCFFSSPTSTFKQESGGNHRLIYASTSLSRWLSECSHRDSSIVLKCPTLNYSEPEVKRKCQPVSWSSTVSSQVSEQHLPAQCNLCASLQENPAGGNCCSSNSASNFPHWDLYQSASAYLEDHFITSPTFTPEILGVDSDQLLSSLNMALNAVFKLVKMVLEYIK